MSKRLFASLSLLCFLSLTCQRSEDPKPEARVVHVIEDDSKEVYLDLPAAPGEAKVQLYIPSRYTVPGTTVTLARMTALEVSQGLRNIGSSVGSSYGISFVDSAGRPASTFGEAKLLVGSHYELERDISLVSAKPLLVGLLWNESTGMSYTRLTSRPDALGLTDTLATIPVRRNALVQLFAVADSERPIELLEESLKLEESTGAVEKSDALIVPCDNIPPVPGTALAASSVTSSSMTLSWGAASDRDVSTSLLKYKLVKATAADVIDTVSKAQTVAGDDILMDWTTATLSRSVTSLAAGTSFAFAVLVKDTSGNVSLYTPITQSTLSGSTDATAPTVGTALSASSITTTTLTLSWGAGSDAVTATGQLQYKLIRAAETTELDTISEADAITGVGKMMDWTAGTTSFNGTGLTEGNTYAFAVLVRDAAGNKSLYTPISVTMKVSIGGAPVRPNKNLGNFSMSATSLPVAHEHAAAVRIGNKMYLVGGNIGSSPDPTSAGLSAGTTTAILESTIASDGTPGPFTKSSYALSVARKGARIEIIGSYAYVFGGYSGSGQTTATPLDSIERATIDDNGLTSSFSVISETLARGRYNFLTLVTNGYIYAIGGGTSDAYHSDTIERATVNTSTGVISSFTAMTRTSVSASEVTNGLVDQRWTHNGIRLGSNFYIMGGEGISTIEKVTINSDGTLGNFQKLAGTLKSARNRLSVIALSGRAYVFGGWNSSYLTTVESAPITNNELGAFDYANGITLNTGVENGTSLLTDKGVFLFGGSNGSVRPYIQIAPLVD
jgi:hypothetical protein